MHYPGRLIADTIVVAARCGVLLMLYWYVFGLNGGLINGTPYIVAAWSMFFYFAFSISSLRGIARLIMQDVRSGNVEILFNKPVSYLLYRMWWQIGSGLYSFLFVSFFGAIVLFFLVGLPPTMMTAIFIPTLLLVTVGATLLSLILYSIIGLLSFWIEDINPIFWVVDKTIMILGGSYLPISLFPAFMYKIALYSPFGATQFITHTVYSTWQSNWYLLIGMQIFWSLVLSSLMFIIYMKAREQVAINGG